MNEYKTIEQIAVLVAVMVPFYLAVNIYEIVKANSQTTWNIIKVMAITLLITFAYVYLEPKQRLICIAWVFALTVIITIAMLRPCWCYHLPVPEYCKLVSPTDTDILQISITNK